MPVVPVPGGKVLAPGPGAFDLSRLVFINHCSSAPIALKHDGRLGKGQNCRLESEQHWEVASCNELFQENRLLVIYDEGGKHGLCFSQASL